MYILPVHIFNVTTWKHRRGWLSIYPPEILL